MILYYIYIIVPSFNYMCSIYLYILICSYLLFQIYDLRSFQCREFCFSFPATHQVAALAAWRAMPIGPWPWKSCDWCRSVLTNDRIVTDAVTDPMRTTTVESEFWIFVIHLLGNAHVYPCVCFVVFVEVVVSKYNSHIISYVPSLNHILILEAWHRNRLGAPPMATSWGLAFLQNWCVTTPHSLRVIAVVSGATP